MAMTKGGVTYYLTYDQVGSLRIVADASGNVIKRVDYDSFGNIASDTNPGFGVPFGFAGGLQDRDTDLVRFGLRDYAPEVGRWTAKDPIFFAGGDVDLFGYVANNPINWIDPRGLENPGVPWWAKPFWTPAGPIREVWEWQRTGTNPPEPWLKAGYVGPVDVYFQSRFHYEQRGQWIWNWGETTFKWGYKWGDLRATTCGYGTIVGPYHQYRVDYEEPTVSPYPR